MARFEHLPIYKQSFSLLVEFHKLIPTFPKKYKFTLGSEIISDLTTSVLLIVQINSEDNKEELLKKLILTFEKLQLQIRVLKHLDVIGKQLYFNLSQKLLALLKQSEGWKKKFVPRV